MQNISEVPPLAGQAESPSSGFVKSSRSPLTLGLVSCGGVGAFLFTVTYLLEGATRPGYSAWQQPISALSLGPGGWMQQVNFVVFGLLTLLSAVGWYRFLSPGSAAIWFPLIQGLSGLTERLSAGSHALWSCVLAATLLFRHRPGADLVKRGRSWHR